MKYPEKMVQLLTEMNRYLTVVRRRNPKLRLLVPPGIIKYFNRGRSLLTESSAAGVPILHECSNVNIYHCCVHKTGSQWIISLLSDLLTYQYSGLTHYGYQSRTFDGYDPRRITERTFTEPFPVHTIVSPMYISYPNYKSLPKSGPHKAFYVMRDPRDVTVSWYFSARYSHVPMGDIPRLRQELSKRSPEEGMLYSIEHLHDFGMYAAMGTWIDQGASDPDVLLIRYEDLASSKLVFFRKLYDFLDIPIPDRDLEHLIEAYSFKRLSGREQGTENKKSHIRKGTAGSWKEHFSPAIASRFYELTGDLVQRLGYEQ